jgi:predicted kinase
MASVHMLIGIPGSGKTTYGKKLQEQYGYQIISTDMVRNTFPHIEEKDVFSKVYQLCAEHLRNNIDIIYDATNITPAVRKRFIDNMKSYGVNYDLIGYFFSIDPEICVQRVVQRNLNPEERYLPPEVPLSYGKNIVPPLLEEGFKMIIVVN